MASYKDFITNPGMPNNKKSEANSTNKPTSNKQKSDLDEKIEEVDNYLKELKQDEIIMKRNKDILDSFDLITGKNKEGAYLKIYEIYKTYKNHPMQKDIMQTRIISTIKNYYNKQLREEAAMKKPVCPQNNHVMENNWVNNNGLWSRKCKICGYTEKKYADPNANANIKAPTRTRKKSPKDKK